MKKSRINKWIRPKTACLILLLLSASSGLSGMAGHPPEEDQTARIEIPAKTDRESYRVIPCSTHGVLVFFKSIEVAEPQKVKWYFSFYDKDLKQSWIKSSPVPQDLEFRFFIPAADTLTLVFASSGKQKNDNQLLEILRISLPGGNFIQNLTMVPANAEPVLASGSGRFLYLGLNYKSGPSAVEIIDLKNNHTKGFFTGKEFTTRLRWMRADTSAGLIRVILTQALNKKENEHWYQEFDTTGNLRLAIKVSTINADRDFNGFQAVNTGEGRMMITGSYRLTASQSSQKNKSTDESAGIFTSLLTAGNQKNLNFYNFLELKSANVFLSPKDILDLKKKALKKGKNIGEYSADFRALLHEPFFLNGEYILVSELYYPRYHVENFTDFDFYGRPVSNSYSVFDGYHFTNAVITAFDPTGRLLWDNTLEIRDVISFDLSPKVNCTGKGDQLIMFYNSEGRIGSKIFRKQETTGNLEFSPLELKYPEDKLLAETRSGILPWYSDYFLCFGFQDIKNVALDAHNRRLVFYVTKVKFEE